MKKIILISAIIVIAIIAGIIGINIYYSGLDDDNENVTVGIVLNGSISDKSWSQSHYEAMLRTSEELGLDLLYRENVPDEGVVSVVKDFAESGCRIIICNSFGYGEYLETIASEYPEIYFFHASGVHYGGNVSTYFGRMYQIRYLCGIVAGMQTKTNEIGYVAAFPISEVNRGINAFTLGVRSVNPNAKVFVKWTNSWVDDEVATKATQDLIDEHDIDILTTHTDSLTPLDVADKNGVMSIGYNFDNSADYPDTYLTSAVWSWENFYIPRISECLQGKFEGSNYWEGVDTGIVSLAPLSKLVAPEISERVEEERERLKSGTFDVFYGPVTDSEGTIRIASDESMTDNNMLNNFDWYVEGVVIDE